MNASIETTPATRGGPLDARTFAIGVLSVTACILFVGLLVVTLIAPQRAMGIGQLDRGGDYIMLTQQVANNYETVIVIDAAAKRLNVYGLDIGNPQKNLRILQRNIPLDRLPGVAVDRRAP